MRNLTIKVRLRLAAVFAMLGICVAAGIGILGMEEGKVGLERSITATTAVLYQQGADMMHDAIRADVLYALKAKADGNAELQAKVTAETVAHAASFKDLYAKLLDLRLTPELRKSVRATQATVESYVATALSLTERAGSEAALDPAVFDDFMAHFYTLEDELGATGLLIETWGSTAGQAALEGNAASTQYAMGVSALAAIALFAVMLFISASITGALDHAKHTITRIASGDLVAEKRGSGRALTSRDEVGDIARALEILRGKLVETQTLERHAEQMLGEQIDVVQKLSAGLTQLAAGNLTATLNERMPESYEGLRLDFNRTLEGLNATMTGVIASANRIRGCSADIGQSSDDLARRTETAAAALEQTSAALSELTSGVSLAAGDAQKVETIVQSAKAEAEQSGVVVAGAVDAMNGIEKSSAQISQIIGVIDDIAFQTNLLALNAGVEAARAGDAGKGFAVVASEVRALAQRSSEASKEIKELIKSSSQFVGLGVEAVARAGHALSNMVGQVSHISTLMSGIAGGAKSQSVSLNEVNSSVGELGQVAQQNAGMVSRTLSSAQELNDEAVTLDAVVARFQIAAVTQQRYAA